MRAVTILIALVVVCRILPPVSAQDVPKAVPEKVGILFPIKPFLSREEGSIAVWRVWSRTGPSRAPFQSSPGLR